MNKRFLVFILTILGVLSLDAQNIIRPKVDFPNGIYVNSYNGVLFYQRPDVSVRNRNLSLEAVFYYNSSSNRKNYGYGNGWSLGSELRFVNDSLGVIIEQGDGRRDLFTRYGSGFEAPAGVFSTLSVEGDGYLLTYKDGTKYYFADTVHKQVTQLKDRYDNTLDFDYQDGRLSAITDISGRSLYFTWTDSLMTGLHTSFDDRTWSYRYDDRGNLTCVTDPMGYSVYYGYNDDNRIKTFTDAEGYSTHISYNVDGMAHRIKTDLTDKAIRYELAKGQTIFIDYLKDARNQYTKYLWDDKGRLVEIENVNMHTSTKFAYDDDNNMVRREDANGHAYTFTYDQNGNMLSSTDPLGYTEYYTYESTFNKVTSYTDKMGHLYTYHYDVHGDLLQMNGPLNFSLSMTYNEYGQVQCTTDAAGHTYFYEYDNYGNMVALTDPLGNVTHRSYNASGWAVTTTQPNGGVTQFNYDQNGNPVLVLDVLDHEMSSNYDRRGNLTTLTDARMNSISMVYDALEQLVQMTDQQGGQRRYTYDAMGNMVKVDSNGDVHRMFYDANNMLHYAVGPLNDTVQCAYDNIGNVVGMKLPNGRVVATQYDAMNRVIQRSDQLGVMYSCTYDPRGNVLSYTDAEGNTSYYEYDALDRMITSTDALGHSEYYSYDVLGNLLTYQDKNGNASVFSYDAMNRMLTKTDAMGYVTSYEYDVMGNVIAMTNANGLTTIFEYDLKGNKTKVTYPEGTTQRFWYDENDNLSAKEDESGRMIHYTYNNMNLLIRVDYPDQVSDAYTYDLNGKMLTATNENAVVTYTYDALGRIQSESINGVVTTYEYDDDYQYVTMIYPSGKTLKQELDLRSRVLRVRDMRDLSVIASYVYDGMDKVIQQTYANGITTDFVYNACGNLVEQYDNANAVHFEITYDANGNIITKKDYINDTYSETYEYNPNNYLIGCQTGTMDANNTIASPVDNYGYELDPVGNIISWLLNGEVSQYYSNGSNTVVSVVDGVEMQSHYNDQGLLVSDNNHTYQYDYNGRLNGVDNGNTATYLYDALGRRIERTAVTGSGTVTEHYQYSGTKLIESNGASGQVNYSNYYSMNGRLMERESGNQQYYYLADQNQSVCSIIDAAGSILESYLYNPNGQITIWGAAGSTISSSALGNDITFFSNQYDPETGFLHGSVFGSDQQYTISPLIGLATNQNNGLSNTTIGDLLGDITGTMDWLAVLSKSGDSFLDALGKSLLKQWPVDDLQYRLANNIPISDTYSDYLRVNRLQDNFKQLDDFLTVLDYLEKGWDIGKAVWNIPELIDNWKNSDNWEEIAHHFGDWIEDVYHDFCPPVALADWFYKKGYKLITGEEADKGLVTMAFEGYGMLADLVGTELDYSCSKFQRSGYDDATLFQKAMANVVNNVDNRIKFVKNVGKTVGNAVGEVKKWFTTK